MELGWVAVGAAIEVLFDTVKKIAVKNVMFKWALERLKTKLEILKPLIEDVKKLNEVLSEGAEEGAEESTYYKLRIREGEEHVRKCSEVGRCNIFMKFHYTNKLQELGQTLDFLIPLVYVTRDSKNILILLRQNKHQGGTGTSTTIVQPPHHDTLPTSQNHHDVGQDQSEWTTRIRAAVRSLLDVVKESSDKSVILKSALNKLKPTLESLQPLIKEIETLNTRLGLPDYEAAYYKFKIDNRVVKVRKWSQFHWFKSFCMKPFYIVMLLKLNKDLQGLVQELLRLAKSDMEKKLISVQNQIPKSFSRG